MRWVALNLAGTRWPGAATQVCPSSARCPRGNRASCSCRRLVGGQRKNRRRAARECRDIMGVAHRQVAGSWPAAPARGPAHHQRWAGRGFPDGLMGEAIPLGARLIAVADAWDAMTSSRPYRTALPRTEAECRLAQGAGTQWDPTVESAFLRLLEQDRAAWRADPTSHQRPEVAVGQQPIIRLQLDRTPRSADGTPLARSA